MAKDRDALLKALDLVEEPAPPPSAKPSRRTAKPVSWTREGLKHIGGYLDRKTVEKFLLLRHRLELDNSELLTRAIDDLYAQEEARAKFGG
jgi:hypothetical protein